MYKSSFWYLSKVAIKLFSLEKAWVSLNRLQNKEKNTAALNIFYPIFIVLQIYVYHDKCQNIQQMLMFTLEDQSSCQAHFIPWTHSLTPTMKFFHLFRNTLIRYYISLRAITHSQEGEVWEEPKIGRSQHAWWWATTHPAPMPCTILITQRMASSGNRPPWPAPWPAQMWKEQAVTALGPHYQG